MVDPLGSLPAGSAASTTNVEDDIDGGPWGALPVGPATSTTDAEDDFDGRPSGGRCRQVWQCAPPRMKKTSVVGPLSGAAGGSGSVHHQC
jgi:hypothetical protein